MLVDFIHVKSLRWFRETDRHTKRKKALNLKLVRFSNAACELHLLSVRGHTNRSSPAVYVITWWGWRTMNGGLGDRSGGGRIALNSAAPSASRGDTAKTQR